MQEILSDIFLPLIVGSTGGIATGFAGLRFIYRKELRLFRNIGRPVCIIGTDDKPMNHEAALLKRVGFFDVKDPTNDSRVIDMFNGYRLAIIGYTPGSTAFMNAFHAVRQHKVPIIVYSGPTRITPDDMEELQTYTHHSVCNTPVRLISDVFTIMSTYPENS